MTDRPENDPPPELQDEIAGLWRPGAPPPRVERTLRAAARARLRPAPWRQQAWVGAVLAAAAGLLLLLWLRAQPEDTRALARADVNRDRVVDILDARDLARHLRRGDAPRERWDVNRDGHVDDADVEAAAREAVRIDR